MSGHGCGGGYVRVSVHDRVHDPSGHVSGHDLEGSSNNTERREGGREDYLTTASMVEDEDPYKVH